MAASIKSTEGTEGLQKTEDMPKNIGQTSYGKDLLSEYEKAYKTIMVTAPNSDKFSTLKKKALIQYANALQKLIQAKSQNLEANDIIEDVIQSKNKLEALEKIQAAPKVEEVAAESKAEKRAKPKKVKKEKRTLPTEEELLGRLQHAKKVAAADKVKKQMMKTSVIIAGDNDATDIIPENLHLAEVKPAAPLLQKNHSYLSDYLTTSLPAAKDEKTESKRAAKEKRKAEKLRHIESVPAPVEEDEFYQKVLNEKQKAKDGKLERAEAKNEEKKEFAKHKLAQSQRNIDYSILKAKGLTRKRNKRDRNPRIKLKYKYAKAIKQRKVCFFMFMQ